MVVAIIMIMIEAASLLACRRASPPTAEIPSETNDDGPTCYPYAQRDGACVEACDPSILVEYPRSHPDCAQGGWPLLCNIARECYPVQPEDYPPGS